LLQGKVASHVNDCVIDRDERVAVRQWSMCERHVRLQWRESGFSRNLLYTSVAAAGALAVFNHRVAAGLPDERL
jgi:hypothetical protein